MAEDWQKMQADITSDLRKDGVEFTFTRKPESEYDPEIGSYLPISDNQMQEFKAYGIIKSLGSSQNALWLAGTTVENGDKMLLVDCSTYKPQLEDSTELYNEIYTIKAIGIIEPGIIPLIQYLLIRKA